MQRNCGVLAYDKLVGELNGRSNVISMDTLAKLATDNGFLLYPTKVPLERMTDVPLPCVVYTNHHFVFIEDLAKLDPVCMSREFIYLLTHELVNPDWVMTTSEAKQIRGADIGQMFTPPKGKSPWEAMTSGSTNGWASFAGPSQTTNPNDPAGWGWVGPALTGAAGLIPGVGPLIAGGMGAAGSMGGGTGFQGTDKGWSNLGSTALGALGGYGMGSVGAGVGGAAKGLMSGAGVGGIMPGFTSGASGYFGTPIVPGWGASSGKNIWSGLTSMFGGGAPAAGSGYAANAAASAPGGLGIGTGTGAGSMMAAGSQGLGNIPVASTGLFGSGSGTSSTMSGIFDLGKSLMGMLSGGGANALETQLFQMPEYQRPPELDAYAAQIGQAKTALGNMSREQISQIISSPIGTIIPDDQWMNAIAPLMTKIDQAAATKKQQTTEAYNSIGRVNSSEHMQELAKIDKDAAQTKVDYQAQLLGQKLTMEMDYKLSALSAALGIDTQAAAELAGLTNLSVQEAALKYGIAVEQVQQLRQVTMLQTMQQQLMAQQSQYSQQQLAQQSDYARQAMAQQGTITSQLLQQIAAGKGVTT